MKQVTLLKLSLKLERKLVSYGIRWCSRIFNKNFFLNNQCCLTGFKKPWLFKESRWAGLGVKPKEQQIGTACVWQHTGWKPEQWVAGTGYCCQEEWAWEGRRLVLWWTTIHSWTRQFWSQCPSHQEVLSKCRCLGTLSQCWDGHRDVEIPDDMDLGREEEG